MMNYTLKKEKSILSSIWDFVVRNTIGDAYSAYMDPEKFLEELHHRSWESGTNIGVGHLGPVWQNWLPKMIYVSGKDNGSFKEIAEYGEESDDLDPAARSTFKVVQDLLGQKTVNNLQGREAADARKKLKRHLMSPQNFNQVYDYSFNAVNEFIESYQQEAAENRLPFPAAINYLTINIMAHCVFGLISKLPEEYVFEIMDIARLITDPWPSATKIQAANKRLNEISRELLGNSSSCVTREGYIADHANLAECSSEEERMEKLQAENIAASFLASTNLSDLIMKTLGAIASDERIKEKLVLELEENWTNDLDSLSQVDYLKYIYLEAQRMFAPSYIARRNSRWFPLFTKDNEGNEHQTEVPPNSYLFAPIKARHLDKHLWDEPYRFMPERFMGEEGLKRQKLLVTFSEGLRACPAKYGFTENLFKTVVAGFFTKVHEINFDRPIETIPDFNINTSWKEEYEAEFIPFPPM